MADEFLHSLTDLWNGGSTTFYAIRMNVTDTASASDSKLIDLQVGGVTQFNVTKAGVVTSAGAATFAGTAIPASAVLVATTREVATGTGLTGGGNLSANRTIALSSASIASLLLADTAVQPARQVATGTGLTGGGDLSADRTLSIAAGGVGTTQLADSAVDTAKLADAAVTTAKIGDGQITTAKIADGAVATAKIGDSQVITAKINDGAVTDAKLTPQARADVASATTTDIGAATTQYVRITGTTTITGLGTAAAGVVRDVLFGDVLTLTHNATSLILPSGANITTAAGDTALLRSEGSGNWRCVRYQRADGTALLGGVDGTTTITRTGGTNSTLLVSAIAKAWANLNGTGTIALRDSFGISSAVDEGTGDYSYNLSAAMANANYKISVSASNSQQFIYDTSFGGGVNPTTTAIRVATRTGASAFQDSTYICVSIDGDLA